MSHRILSNCTSTRHSQGHAVLEIKRKKPGRNLQQLDRNTALGNWHLLRYPQLNLVKWWSTQPPAADSSAPQIRSSYPVKRMARKGEGWCCSCTAGVFIFWATSAPHSVVRTISLIHIQTSAFRAAASTRRWSQAGPSWSTRPECPPPSAEQLRPAHSCGRTL